MQAAGHPLQHPNSSLRLPLPACWLHVAVCSRQPWQEYVFTASHAACRVELLPWLAWLLPACWQEAAEAGLLELRRAPSARELCSGSALYLLCATKWAKSSILEV